MVRKEWAKHEGKGVAAIAVQALTAKLIRSQENGS